MAANQRTTFKLVTTSAGKSNFVKMVKRMKRATAEENMGAMAKETLRRSKALEEER